MSEIKSTSVIELDQKALQSNIDFLRTEFGSRVKISSVVKGNAYGHGIEEFIPMAEKCGIDHFSVFSANEALCVWKYKSKSTKVMIMGFVDDHEIDWAVNNDIEFYVFELGRLKNAIKSAGELGKTANVHIEVETGMNRTGFQKKTLTEVVKLINDNKKLIRVRGLCTHYAGAESIANHVRVQKQYRNFIRIYNWLVDQGIQPEIKHTASSAAAMTYAKTRMDMVRVGILQYGLWPGVETLIHFLSRKKEKLDPLQRVISWKTKIMSIKDVRQGEFVSYGTSYFATDDKRIAIIPVGYSYGYSRSLSNSGRVLIGGQRVLIIGNVNMNMIIADITNLPEVKVGDEVVLIGSQGDSAISVASFTGLSDQLNYELLSRLPVKITRIINQ